jgi:hypothetical protein
MSRISDIHNQHERTDFAESGARTTPFRGLSARTHMSNVCTDDASIYKGKTANDNGGQDE